MAVRTLIISVLYVLVIFGAGSALACFGPKLFIGMPDDPQGQILASIVSVYVKEKTGIETERVAIGNQDATKQIIADTLDYGFAVTTAGLPVLLEVDGLPSLVSGPRIPNDLQFTTVAPALERLQRLLSPAHVRQIQDRVQAGELPMAAARTYLLEQRWI